MTRVLVAVAALALGASGALACPFHDSASLDTQTVASVDAKRLPMSTPDQAAPEGQLPNQQAPAESVD
jgi:hypothetical protein